MGPSGSGKTTLMDLLAGRKTVGAISGSIRIAGRPPTREFLRRHVGYVEQFGASATVAQQAGRHIVTAHLLRFPVSKAPTNCLRASSLIMTISMCADTLLANLTVLEMLLYTAEMRNKVSLSAEAKREHVETVLAALGLQPCRDVLIGDPLHRGISGVCSPAMQCCVT